MFFNLMNYKNVFLVLLITLFTSFIQGNTTINSDLNTLTTESNQNKSSEVATTELIPLMNNETTTEMLKKDDDIQLSTSQIEIPCPSNCKCATTLIDAVCTGRGLTEIPTGFSTHVKMLILTSNKITEIAEDTFKERQLYELMSLLINHNQISTLHPNAFIILKHLEVLDLGDNNLKQFDANIFLYNSALVTLRLDNNCQLQIPKQGALINSQTLRDLNMSSCNITHLNDDIFSGTPSLDTIDLTGNQLIELNPNVLKILPDLTSVILPKSFEPKSLEICEAHSKLDRIVIKQTNRGDSTGNDDEYIYCASLFLNQVKKRTENVTDLVKNQNLTVPDEHNNYIDELYDEPLTSNETKINKIIMTSSSVEAAAESPPAAEASSFSTMLASQTDNIIIAILTTALTVAILAAVIQFNKKRINRMFGRREYKQRSNGRKSAHNDELEEGEPLRNMASNP